MDSRKRRLAGESMSAGTEQVIAAVASGVLITQFALESEAGVSESLLSVGVPILIGASAANFLLGTTTPQPQTFTKWLQLALVSGAIGTAAMMAVGAMPVTLDAGTLGFVGLVGASTVLGTAFSDVLKIK